MNILLVALTTLVFSCTSVLTSVTLTPGIHETNDGGLKFVANGNNFQFDVISVPFRQTDPNNCERVQILLGLFAGGMFNYKDELATTGEMFRENFEDVISVLSQVYHLPNTNPFMSAVIENAGVEEMRKNPNDAFQRVKEYAYKLRWMVNHQKCACSQISGQYECFFPRNSITIGNGVSVTDLLTYYTFKSATEKPRYLNGINFNQCETMKLDQYVTCIVGKINKEVFANRPNDAIEVPSSSNTPRDPQHTFTITSSNEVNIGLINQVPIFILFFISAVFACGWI